MEKKVDKKMIILAVLITAGSLLFLLVGYYGSLFLFPYLYPDSAEQSMYFNVLTPICMVICFFVYEGVVFLVYFLKEGRRRSSFLESLTEDVILEENEKEIIAENGMEKDEVQETEKEGSVNVQITDEKEVVTENNVEEDDEVVFDENIFLPLYDDYSMDQLKAMMRIGKYMDHVDAEMLRQMFRKDMSAEEIGNYITMYYS